ncbi:MAG: CBS domain-containing protein [Calditrichia bacterium]
MKVRDLIKKKGSEVFTTSEDIPVPEAINSLNTHNVGALLVMKDEIPVGIITERDILHAVGNHGADLKKMTVKDLMTPNLLTCSPGDFLDDIMQTMTDKRIRHLPVVENNKLEAMISIGDVVKALLEQTSAESENLRDYIHGRR